jgi:streptogramin lyase
MRNPCRPYCLLFLTIHAVSPAHAETSYLVSTFAGTGRPGFAADDGVPATAAQLNNPFGIVRGPDGALYVCDTGNHAIRAVRPDGTPVTIAGAGKPGYAGDGGPALEAFLNEPYEIRFDRSGNIVFVEMRNHLVRRIDARTGIISALAGTGRPGFSGDDGPATKAQLNQPHSIQFDRDGHLYVCDIGNHRIRKVDAKTGAITTFAGTGDRKPTPDGAPFATAPLNGPRAIDFDRDGDMYLALREGNAVYRLNMKNGTIHHVAGTGRKGFTGHGGPAKLATLSGPKGLAIGPDGNVYLADTESHSIRMINLKAGTLDLIAGTGQAADGPDGDPLKCSFARPHGVFVDRDGAIYVGDSENHRIRVIRRE